MLSYFSAYFVADPIFSKAHPHASVSLWLFYFLGYCCCLGLAGAGSELGRHRVQPHPRGIHRIPPVSTEVRQQKTFNCHGGDDAERGW